MNNEKADVIESMKWLINRRNYLFATESFSCNLTISIVCFCNRKIVYLLEFCSNFVYLFQ